MSNEDFRKIIDDARQILVGKLPNPQDQIDAITYALMYKFMSDIDDKSAALPGGKRTYFADDYEKYGWHNLMRADGQDQLILYREAIEKMSKNAGLPALFREIFNGAMLKFNDPRTLRLFLKEIDKFSHGGGDHLGDAYEYLLSLMSSQGGLGQFRTPRHIIKFIVDVVDPDKTDKIVDPAVGTAGFLIEAYNHIRRKHDGLDEDGNQNGEKRLSSAELDKIHENFRGFDIDATMIRTARVNMYLHGFKTPDIIEHDTLTSEDYWQDRYDVILANPPFMTPKGGIQPHKKFGVQANRSEVLFVDYISSHLKPSGKAGFIVPEGIVFQSGTAYKQLRKNLVDNSLYAVISLPAGVFQPYSGVKTSILFLDPEIAKAQDTVLFGKVNGDGFTLNAKRTLDPLHNDLPQVLDAINLWKTGNHQDTDLLFEVSKSEIAKKDYILDGGRYKVNDAFDNARYPLVPVADLVDVISGAWGNDPGVDEVEVGALKVGNIKVGGIIDYAKASPRSVTKRQFEANKLQNGDVVVVKSSGSATNVVSGKAALVEDIPSGNYIPVNFLITLRPDTTKILPRLLYQFLSSDAARQHVLSIVAGATYPNLKTKEYLEFKVPLPPIEVQKQIAAEIENKQQAINHAREVIKVLERERELILIHALAPSEKDGQ